MADKLTPKQELFCKEYLKDLNATQAAIRAGYSEDTARQMGSENLSKPDIVARLTELNHDRLHKLKADAESILRELLHIAGVDVGAAFTDDSRLLPIKEIPPEIRRTICSIEVDELFEGLGKDRVQVGVTRKVKFWDKTKALEMLGRHLKLFTDKVEHSGTVRLEDLIGGGDDSVNGKDKP